MSLELKRQWDQKLLDSGFQDIEDDQGRLKEYHSTSFRKRIGFQADLIESIQAYFTWASEMRDSSFKSPTDYFIWIFHSDGQSARGIAKKMGFDHTWICRKIKRIRNELRMNGP